MNGHGEGPPVHQIGTVRTWATQYVTILGRTYTTDQVAAALNRAADDIIEAIDARDQGVRDALNLQVNATLTYLGDPDADLEDAIKANYQIEPGAEGPVDWIKDNT